MTISRLEMTASGPGMAFRHPAVWEKLCPGVIFILLLSLYIMTMPEHATLEDAGILITVAQFAGIAHPPGYPLYTMLGKLFTLLPFGSIAFRVHLLSALAGALACVCLYCCCLVLSRQRTPAFFAALFYGVSGLLWRQSLVAEVYTLHALFLFLLLYLALRLQREFNHTDLYLFTFVFALALSHHWPLLLLNSVLFLPLFLAMAQRPRLSSCLAIAPKLAALTLVGLSPYLYLVIRSSFEPYIMAFGPVTLADLPDYVLRQRYSATDVSPTASLADSLLFVLHFLREGLREMGVVSTLAVGLGLAWALAHEKRSIVAALLVGFCASPLLLLVFLKFDYDILRRDAYMFYQAVPFGFCALFLHYCLVAMPKVLPERLRSAVTAGAVGKAGEKLRGSTPERTVPAGASGKTLPPGCNRLTAVTALAGALLCVTTWVGNAGRNDMRNNTFAFDYASTVLEALPEGAALFLHVDQDLGPLSYARYGARVREDVRLYSQHGHLFGNRIFGARDGEFASAQTTLLKFLDGENEKRLFVNWPSELFQAQPERGVYLHNHGLFYELSRSETKTAVAMPSSVIRAFLDRHWPDAYGDSWMYHRQRIFAEFCYTLMLRDESHPALEEHYYCKLRLAQNLYAQQQHERAAELFREQLATGTPWPKDGLAHVYFNYLLAELAVINRKPPQPDLKLPDIQRLIDEVYPVTKIWPTCDNKVTRALLELGSQGPLNIHLNELAETFGHCGNLAPLFKKVRDSRQ